MYGREPTYIGKVRRVLGSQVTVELDPDLAGVSPVFRGQMQPVGQVGSLVRIPQGIVDLVATVTLVGIAELAGAQAPTDMVHAGERWLQVQLLGEIDRGSGIFQRGVANFPSLDDPVHFALTEQLAAVFPAPDHAHVRIGHLSASELVPVALDAAKLVTRHAAVVGSTGSGKTSAVAAILQSLCSGGWPSANIIVIDTHGEYAHALGGQASIRTVQGAAGAELRVPFWALPASDILQAFTGMPVGSATAKAFAGLVADARKHFVESCDWLDLPAETVTSDTPVPFDLREVWYLLDRENRETRTVKEDPSTASLVDPGSPSELRPAQFEPYGAGSQPPHRNPSFGFHGNVPEQLRLGLRDPRLAFLQGTEVPTEGTDPLAAAMQQWLGLEKPVSVLDFSGIPTESAELAIGLVLHLIFEVAIRTTVADEGIGRPRPVLIVLEEAHRYLGEDSTPLARQAANRIAREGRKYGVGLLLVTQRPSELPDTALAQCGTLIALRLSNGADQAKVRAALPDSVAGLAEILPSLRTGEAVVSGEALVLPTRAVLDRPDPRPLAEDPPLDSWRVQPSAVPNVTVALGRWRGTYQVDED